MSYTSISIKERKDPIALAMKYVINNLGINIRPKDAFFNEEEKHFIINLNAIIPNEISPIGKAEKSIIFIFENIGKMIMDKDGKVIKSDYAQDIEDRIQSEFWKLHQKVEDTIKEYGKNKWGRLVPFKWFLKPIYAIVNRLIIDGELKKSRLIVEDYWKYVIPLLDNDLVTYDSHNEDKLICSNLLNGLIEKCEDQITISELAVGIIVASSTDYLVNELKVSTFLPYIDFPKMYYLDALEYGEMIELSYDDLFKKYIRFSRKGDSTFKKDLNFQYMITDLVSAEILTENKTNNSISGVDKLFNEVIKYREDILSNANMIIEGF